MKLFSKNTLNLFDYFLIIGIIALNIAYTVVSKEFDIIGTIASITGVLCVVLVAKRSISNYLFGLINVSLYAYIALESKLYGDFMLNAFYYIPMQFVGWYLWLKDKGDYNDKGILDETIVKSKLLTKYRRLLLFVFSSMLVFICGFFLDNYTLDPQPYKDAATTILSVIAMFLMVKKYMEQWIMWEIINAISVFMWIAMWFEGEPHAGLMAVMWLFQLANSINGMIVWNRAAERNMLKN